MLELLPITTRLKPENRGALGFLNIRRSAITSRVSAQVGRVVVEATCQFSVYILVVSANAELIEAWIPITAARSAKFASFFKSICNPVYIYFRCLHYDRHVTE